MSAERVSASQRHTKARPCPICGGAPGDPRGRGKRCHGYSSADGLYAHCTRDEHAGSLTQHPESGTYAHRLSGPCKCGTMHSEPVASEPTRSRFTATYTYYDEQSKPLFRVHRTADKSGFPQEHYTADGSWKWGRGGARRVLYRLPELLTADKSAVVFVVEGEKDVERLRQHGAIATCNPEGSGKWGLVDGCKQEALAGRRVIVIADADTPGRQHAETVKKWAANVCAFVRVLDLYPEKTDGSDVSNWFDEGNSLADLMDLVGRLPEPAAEDPWDAELTQALEDVQSKLGTQQAAKRAPLFATTAAELLKAEFPPTQWQVTGLVTKRGTAVASGEPKAGIKTWMLIEGAIAVATGTKMFGEFFAERGTVAFFFAEDHAQSVRNRVRALLAGGDREPPENLYLQPRGEFIDVRKDEDLAWVIASARRLPKLDLLVLDPLRDIHSAAEDKSDEMSPVMRRIRLLGEILGCTVWISHHDKKASADGKVPRAGQGMRGSSAIHGSIDSGMYITPNEKGSNGTNRFSARVRSQVKNARSARAFDLTLAIEDDENGEAIKATWQYTKPEDLIAAHNARVDELVADSLTDQLVWQLVRDLESRGQLLTQTEIRDLHPCPVDVAQKARIKSLKRLLDRGHVRTEMGRFRASGCPAPGQSEGTPK